MTKVEKKAVPAKKVVKETKNVKKEKIQKTEKEMNEIKRKVKEEIYKMKRGKRYANFVAEITDSKISILPNVKIRQLESAMTHALNSGKKNMSTTMIFRNYYGFGCKQMTMKEIENSYHKTEAQIHTIRNECLNKMKNFKPFQVVLLLILKDHTIP